MKPFTNEEICSHFEKLDKIEDATELRRTQQKVFADVLMASSFLPWKMVKRYKGLDNYEDLHQVASMVMFQAIRSFDYKISRNFYAWSYRWIKKEVAIAAFRQKRYADSFSLVDGKDLCINELADSNPEQDLFLKELDQILSSALDGLSKKPRSIIRKVFGIGESRSSLREISQDVCISHEQVRRLKDVALQQLSCDPTLIRTYG